MFQEYTRRQRFDSREFYWLWLLVAVTYGAGDVLTTLTITGSSPGVVEGNVLVATAIHRFGPAGLVVLKIAILVASIGVSLYGLAVLRDRTLYYAPPVMLTGMGAFATTYNLVLLTA